LSIGLDAGHFGHSLLEKIFGSDKERIVTEMDAVIAHVSDHDIALRD